MLRRTAFNPLLASSLISSEEMIHLRISSKSGVSGSIPSKNSSKESEVSASSVRSFLEYALARFATSNNDARCSSSSILRDAPISRRFMEAVTSWTPKKERLPFLKIRLKASAVCLCAVSISARDVIGVNFLQRCFAASQFAWRTSRSIIL